MTSLSTSSTAPSGDTKMSFDEDSLAHLMGVLTDLYSDKPLAVIREYSTNALDAHRAAGNTAPIKVTLPISDPFFVVEDQGIGMSEDDLMNQFSKYGWSSKRGSDTEVGMLGLGCKSALSYTNEFWIEAVKDRKRVKVKIYRDAKGVGAIHVMERGDVDRPNGVKVWVPMASTYDMHAFREKGREFFRFWEKGTVLVDGVEPESIFDEGLSLDDDVVLAQLRSDYIVMGNVPYPVDSMNAIRSRGNHKVVARVPIGSVNFVPSREALQYTEMTEAVLNDLRDFVQHTVQRKANEAVDALTSPQEVLQVADQWRPILGWGVEVMWKGTVVPSTLYMPDSYRWRVDSAIDTKAESVYSLASSRVGHLLFITGHKAKGMNGAMKERLHKYTASMPNVKEVVTVESLAPWSPWLDDAHTVDVAELRKIELASAKKATGPMVDVYTILNSEGHQEDKILGACPQNVLFYATKKEFKEDFDYRASYIAKIVADEGGTLVVLGANQVDKFCREYPNASHWKGWFALRTYTYYEGLTPEKQAILSDGYFVSRMGLNDVTADAVLDPKIKGVLNLVTEVGPAEREAWGEHGMLASMLGVKRPDQSINFGEQVRAMISKDYPLMVNSHASLESRLEYMNSMYLVRNLPRLLP